MLRNRYNPRGPRVLGFPRLTLQRDTLGFTRVQLPICAAFCSGAGLRSRNSQTCPTRFRISELGNPVQIVRRFRYGVSVRLTNHRDSGLRWFMGVKQMFILIDTSPGLEIIARWGNLPISMVLRSEESLKSEMQRLARTSKYLIHFTSVLRVNKSEEDSQDRQDSSNLIVIVVINPY